jgi:hypothetical protein
MKAEILASILAIVLVAGCTVPGMSDIPGISGGNNVGIGGRGLEITSFTAEPATLYNGSTVRVVMEVENQGGSTAFNTSGLFVYLTGSNLKITGGTADNKYWHRTSSDTTTSECYVPDKNFKPADVVQGTAGTSDTYKWSLRAPDLDKGQTRTDSFIGRVYTVYETAANGNVWAYTEAESDAAKASGRGLETASFTTTSGPVGLSVSVTPNPVVVSSNDKSFTLNIKISNTASGTIYAPGKIPSCPPSSSLTPEDFNKVDLTIAADDFDISGDCKTGSSTTTQQELISGKPTTIICDMTVKTASMPSTFKSYPVTIKVQYGYYTERQASVTVQGK